ncbi:hypothetical protein Afe04nite_27620 [Asanoa ferruginea]|nr:hypothetical protein Afe04nite_27620 [Asanoa ferruginea]
MTRRYRNTLKAHAHALSSLGAVMGELAHEHRVAAAAVEQRRAAAVLDPMGGMPFPEWIATASEISTAAERLLELQVELARTYGMTWEQIADVLGVSRQAAWERFNTHARRDRTHRIGHLRRTRRATMFRRMAVGQSPEVIATLRRMMRTDFARRPAASPRDE